MDSILIICVINVNQQNMLNKCIIVKVNLLYLKNEFNLYLYQKNENLFQFFQIQSLIQISHKLNWFGLKREELMTIFVWILHIK